MHPIELKFTFTSIDAAIAFMSAHNAKADPLPVIDAPKSAQAPAPAAGQATAKESAAPKKTVAAPSPVAPSAEAAPQASTAATEGNAAAGASTQEAPAASTASSSAPVEYPVLQKAVFALAGKSREAAAAVAASFGVKTFKELPEAKWADALAAVQAKTAEL